MPHVKICAFVEKELRYFREECNFTDNELEYFNLRAKGKSIVEISMAMNISERSVGNLAKAVNKKIIKML